MDMRQCLARLVSFPVVPWRNPRISMAAICGESIDVLQEERPGPTLRDERIFGILKLSMATHKMVEKVDDLEQVLTLETLPELRKQKLDNITTLGSVQLQNVETKETILIPTPSSDPNDPLNWYAAWKIAFGPNGA